MEPCKLLCRDHNQAVSVFGRPSRSFNLSFFIPPPPSSEYQHIKLKSSFHASIDKAMSDVKMVFESEAKVSFQYHGFILKHCHARRKWLFRSEPSSLLPQSRFDSHATFPWIAEQDDGVPLEPAGFGSRGGLFQDLHNRGE